jgi:hypothetical protein
MPWGNAKQICAAAGQQENPDAIIKNNTIYSVWDDGRPGAFNYYIYVQKTDTAGNMLWTPDGVQICNLTSGNPYPKLVSSGNNIMATYAVTGGFRGQKIRTDSTTMWQQNGVMINIPNVPAFNDYQLVPSANNIVTAIWREGLDNICAARVRADGTLTNIVEHTESEIGLFPNPATNQFSIQLSSGNHKDALISIYNTMGELIFRDKNAGDINGLINISSTNFPAGFYFIEITAAEFRTSAKVCVVKE